MLYNLNYQLETSNLEIDYQIIPIQEKCLHLFTIHKFLYILLKRKTALSFMIKEIMKEYFLEKKKKLFTNGCQVYLMVFS